MRPISNGASFDPYEQEMTQSVEDIAMRSNVVALIDDMLPKSINIRSTIFVQESLQISQLIIIQGVEVGGS